ncbi:hypothetical protein K503DRAFT_867745 [Rhizopogon vinicolor AM-OR11-026]|uniref:Uncharacterized protein n=1 Tax=Rhizopogon vinicolor AM-OR11-026 TaxID=1314800 RepID=A0A1B7MUB7_9AGAM|nr:hypothetical protein K503DRAFT_867745 [Rhizopogon vinicolor AM-OR11-026]
MRVGFCTVSPIHFGFRSRDTYLMMTSMQGHLSVDSKATTSPQSFPFDLYEGYLNPGSFRRDSNNYPSALHSESGDSIPRRPRKRRILYSAPSSGEGSPDIVITEAYDSAAIKHNHNDVITTNICADTHSSAPCYLAPPSKAMSNYTSKVLSVHSYPRNDQGHEQAVGLNRAYECALTYPLIVNDDSPSVCLKDSSPVPAIDFTRMRFPSRNRWRFPLLRLEPANAKAEGKEAGEGSVRSVSSNCIPFVCLHRMYLQLYNFQADWRCYKPAAAKTTRTRKPDYLSNTKASEQSLPA